MHRLISGVVMLTAIAGTSGPVGATPGPGHTVICSAQTHICIVTATSPGAPGNSSPKGPAPEDANVRPPGGTAPPDPCHYQLTDPQPPASDPIWAGHAPGSGAIYERVCQVSIGMLVNAPVFVPDGAAPVPVVATPLQLARQAVAQVKVPDPTVERSPSAQNVDQGMPYTWVNLWTWFWTSPQTWQPLSRTATVGAVWARVTIRPDRLVFDPGDGESSVTCPGPGRPWRDADGDDPPSGGETIRGTV